MRLSQLALPGTTVGDQCQNAQDAHRLARGRAPEIPSPARDPLHLRQPDRPLQL